MNNSFSRRGVCWGCGVCSTRYKFSEGEIVLEVNTPRNAPHPPQSVPGPEPEWVVDRIDWENCNPDPGVGSISLRGAR